ncbi:tyrosine-protein phosphatase [Levilactobacillus enshiensis]|uniref:tyrosine-protein phosphatase n=1 Tax=Levilactobacillus enshiensis TaxID=2590213 RepID=UPI00117A36F7|nr:tyrosine-protein phosphatase [Levilactobacillus enshiensis]
MNQHLQRTLSLSMLTMTLMGMGTPVVTSLAATTPATHITTATDPDRTPLMNGEKMPETVSTPTVPAAGQPGSRIALSMDNKGFNANTRDLGGYLTKDRAKMIKPGVLFRSAQLTKLNVADISKLEALKLGLIIDLRTPKAHLNKTDKPIGQAINKDDSIYSQADDDDLSGIDHYNRQNGGSIAFSATALSGYHAFLTDLLAAKGPVLYHCKHGNDRTGIATVILMSILGISNQSIINDYLMSNNYVSKQVDYAWLKTYFSQIDEKFGGFENYIASKDGLNFSSAQQATLRAKYLVASEASHPGNGTSGSEKPVTPDTTKPDTEKPSTPNVSKPSPEKPTTPGTAKPGTEKPSTSKPTKPGVEKPTQPKPVVPKPHTPAIVVKPETTGEPTAHATETLSKPAATSTLTTPQKTKRVKVKVISVKKIKHAKLVHLKAHRAYFFDLHLKHKVGKSGKTGQHPQATWKIIKQAKLRVNGKAKTYVEVQSPHGKKRWLQLKDVLLIKPVTHHTN